MANQNNFISAAVQLGKQMDMLSQEMKEQRTVTHDVQFPHIDESMIDESREQHFNDPLSENRRYGQFSEVTDQMRGRNAGKESFRDRKIKYRRKDKKSDLDAAQEQHVRNSTSSVSDNPAVEIAPILMDGIDPLIKSNEEVNESIAKNAEKMDKMTEALAMLAARLGHGDDGNVIKPFLGEHDDLFHYDPAPENKYKTDIGDDKSFRGAMRRGLLDSDRQLNAPKTYKEKFGRLAGRVARGFGKAFVGDYIASDHGHKVQQDTYLSPLLDKERSAHTDREDQLRLRDREEEERDKITQKIHESRGLGKKLRVEGVDSSKLKHYDDPNEQANHIMRMKVAQKNLEAHVAFDPTNSDKTAELQKALEDMRQMVYGDGHHAPVSKASPTTNFGKKSKKQRKFDAAPQEPAEIMPEMSREDKMRNLLQNDPIGLLAGKYEGETSISNRDKLKKIKEENRRSKGRFGKASNISYVRDKLSGTKAEHRSRLGGNGKSRNADTMKVNKMVVGKLVTNGKGDSSSKKNKEDAPKAAKQDAQQVAPEQQQEQSGGGILDTIMDFMGGGKGGIAQKAGLGRLASFAAPLLPAMVMGGVGYAAASQAESADMTTNEDFNVFASVARGAKSFADSANSFFGFGNSAKTKLIQSQIENGATFSQEEADKIKADYGFDVPATAIQSAAVQSPVITATDVAPVQSNQANEFDAINNTNTALKQEAAQVSSAPVIVNNNNQNISQGGGGGHVGVTTATRPSENSFQRFTNRTFVPY